MSERIKQELLAIQRASKDRMLHAGQVVSWARTHAKSALHSRFQWNNEKAAHEYRLWQARQLITIHIVNEQGLPQIVSLSIDRSGAGGYRLMDDVLAQRDLTEIMLGDALKELNRVQETYAQVKQLASVWDEVERVRTRGPKKKGPRGRGRTDDAGAPPPG
jgi:hypothetical protein